MKSNGKPIHTGMLKPSTQDTIMLCEAVSERFFTVRERFRKKWRCPLILPGSMDNDIKRWQSMIDRFKLGDYRNSDAELQSLKSIAQWTVDINNQICGQPDKKLVWRS